MSQEFEQFNEMLTKSVHVHPAAVGPCGYVYTLLRSRAPGVSLFNDLTDLEIDLELPPSNWELQTLGRGALHEKHNVSLVMRKLLAGISKSLGGISKSISKALRWDFQAILLKCFACILGSGHIYHGTFSTMACQLFGGLPNRRYHPTKSRVLQRSW